MFFALLLSLVPPPRLALLGDYVAPAELHDALTTEWTLRPYSNASSEEIASAIAFVQTPLTQLDNAAAGLLYQYSFTGYAENDLAQIPPSFTVANCHQASSAIAEYVLAAMLHWTVKLDAMDAALRQCTWKTAPPGNQDCASARIIHRQISNMTLGVLGYGHIGEAIATRAHAFGTRTIATTLNPPTVVPSPLAWIGDDTKNAQLFAESDFVVVCTPLLNTTVGLVDADLLAHLSPTAVILNIARGAIIDEDALYSALVSRAIGGAVIDVWWQSISQLPEGGVGPDAWPSKYRFDKLDNVIMSAHTSGNTDEAHAEALQEVAQNLDLLANDEPLLNVVRNGTLLQSYETHNNW